MLYLLHAYIFECVGLRTYVTYFTLNGVRAGVYTTCVCMCLCVCFQKKKKRKQIIWSVVDDFHFHKKQQERNTEAKEVTDKKKANNNTQHIMCVCSLFRLLSIHFKINIIVIVWTRIRLQYIVALCVCVLHAHIALFMVLERVYVAYIMYCGVVIVRLDY